MSPEKSEKVEFNAANSRFLSQRCYIKLVFLLLAL
jgi:hypothetical protein